MVFVGKVKLRMTQMNAGRFGGVDLYYFFFCGERGAYSARQLNVHKGGEGIEAGAAETTCKHVRMSLHRKWAGATNPKGPPQ